MECHMNFLPIPGSESPPAVQAPRSSDSHAPHRSSLTFSLLATFLVTFVGITLYEVTKAVWSPALGLWESLMTVAVVSMMAPCIALVVFRKQAALSAHLQSELKERKSAQT